MSIENDLKRIADALEKLAGNGLNAPATDLVHGMVVAKPLPATIAAAAAENENLPTTAAELKVLAQQIAAKLPEGSIHHFTDYVRNEICARAGVKKLNEVSPELIGESAKALLAYKPEKK
jgi:hypothetical protein